MADVLSTVSVVIPNGGSVSAAIKLTPGAIPVAIQMPADWTTADLFFQGSYDGETFVGLFDGGGTEYRVTADASRYIVLTPQDFAGLRWVKLRSGGTQAADRVLLLVIREM